MCNFNIILVCVTILSTLRSAVAISCYKCNSDYDPHCGLEFIPYTLGVVNCSLLPRLDHLPDDQSNAILCRKTTQRIGDKLRIVRGCGYIIDKAIQDAAIKNGKSDARKRCITRTGTPYTSSTYCECFEDKCNAAAEPNLKSLLATFAIIIIYFITLKF